MNPSYVVTGTCNGTAINVDVGGDIAFGSDVAVYVTLSANYVLSSTRPPGFPFRPFITGAAAAGLDYPQTIASGTRIQLLSCEATALVNGGFASYS